jgi:hypothetical protein
MNRHNLNPGTAALFTAMPTLLDAATRVDLIKNVRFTTYPSTEVAASMPILRRLNEKRLRTLVSNRQSGMTSTSLPTFEDSLKACGQGHIERGTFFFTVSDREAEKEKVDAAASFVAACPNLLSLCLNYRDFTDNNIFPLDQFVPLIKYSVQSISLVQGLDHVVENTDLAHLAS